MVFSQILLIIFLFSIIELVISLFWQCKNEQKLFDFIEISGLIGIFSTIFYVTLKQIEKTYESLYLLFSNIYFVLLICTCIYWLINLSIESRDFFEKFTEFSCENYIRSMIFICFIGNYMIFILLICSIIYFCYFNKQNLYSQTVLVE